MKSRSRFGQAAEHLRAADPVLGRLISRIGPLRVDVAKEGTHFGALVRAILYQQLAGAAAAAIAGRFETLFGGRFPAPEELAAIADERLRAAGLSRQKLAYMKDLAAKAGPLAIERLHELPD